jgi:hypothetical protein
VPIEVNNAAAFANVPVITRASSVDARVVAASLAIALITRLPAIAVSISPPALSSLPTPIAVESEISICKISPVAPTVKPVIVSAVAVV